MSDRSYKIQRLLKSKIKDIFTDVFYFKLTIETLNDKINTLMNGNEAKRTPSYIRSYLQGYIDARRDDIYRNHLVWLKSCDGKLLTTEELDRLIVEEVKQGYLHPPFGSSQLTGITKTTTKSPWQRTDPDLSCHVWKDVQGNPLRDKPF